MQTDVMSKLRVRLSSCRHDSFRPIQNHGIHSGPQHFDQYVDTTMSYWPVC